MFYREAGQFKTNYADDSAMLPLREDRWFMWGLLALAFVGVPLFADQYWMAAILTPFLIFSLAAIGLNILTGVAGQLSLGAAAFMAVGAFAAYNIQLRLPEVPLLVNFFLSGMVAAAVGVLFGLPSLRIKGLYLAVTTLAAQFFCEWLFTSVGWFYNDVASGSVSPGPMSVFGIAIDTVTSKYVLTLSIVVVMTVVARNLLRARIGREWRAIHDMEVSAEVIGIKLARSKLTAFAVSSFFLGVAGALYGFTYLGSIEAAAFDLHQSFIILFMIIIGGMGSLVGSFLGAAFIMMFPIFMNQVMHATLSGFVDQAMLGSLELLIFGGLIIFFLIVEPAGLARLWQVVKNKLRLWPFPH